MSKVTEIRENGETIGWIEDLEFKESFGKKVKRKTLNFLSKHGTWITTALVTGGTLGYLAGKHKATRPIYVIQVGLEEPNEDYQQEVDVDTEVQDLEDFGQDEHASESVE